MVALATVMPASALAQNAWLADRARTEGPGFRVGDFELHPGIGAEVGWDSNLYFTEDNPTAGRHRVDTGILRITPHFLFSTIGPARRQEGSGRDDTASASPPTVAFRGGISAAYYEFFAAPERRNLDINGSLRLQVLPERPFSFSIWDNFTRGIRPFTENFNMIGASQARISNQAGLDLQFQTDGGMVQVRAGYTFGLDFFEDSRFQYGNSFTHTVTLQESFRFLPQTALIHDTVVAVQDYFSTSAADPTLVLDNVRLRSRLGLNGAITESITAQAMVGYAAGFYPQLTVGGTPYRQDYDSIVAQVELGWTIMEGMRLGIGYDRDFFPSYVGNYYSRDRGYLNFQMLLGGAFLLALDFDVGYMDFGLIRGGTAAMPIIDTTAGLRNDIRVGGGLFAEYRFTEWLGVNATFRYQGQFTSYQFTNVSFVDPAQYNKFEVFGGVRVFY
ncbi:MAG: hypothetical protein K1X94_02480 [Sandaracinaceae bacterium]|nr:hypothetical protein [Sandaracinaceae bacterium]